MWYSYNNNKKKVKIKIQNVISLILFQKFHQLKIPFNNKHSFSNKISSELRDCWPAVVIRTNSIGLLSFDSSWDQFHWEIELLKEKNSWIMDYSGVIYQSIPFRLWCNKINENLELYKEKHKYRN